MPNETGELTGEITGDSRGNVVSLKTNKSVWDTLSFQLALMNDASNKSNTYDYNVISRGEVKKYTFLPVAEETIEVNDEEHKTVKLERHNGEKITKIWLAKELHYVPILIEKFKDGDLDSTMTLDSITFNSTLIEDEQDEDK